MSAFDCAVITLAMTFALADLLVAAQPDRPTHHDDRVTFSVRACRILSIDHIAYVLASLLFLLTDLVLEPDWRY